MMGLPVSPGGSMIPPLQLSMPTSSTAGPAQGGSAAGGGMGALNQGDWIIQKSGTGDVSAATGGKVNWLYIAAAAGAAWLLAKR
jgi:hypothetical protein